MLQMLGFLKCISSVILLSIVLTLAWCYGVQGADQMRVGYGSLSTSYAAIWVAGEARLFQKNGINAEVLYLESALVRTALIAGEIAMGGIPGPRWPRPVCKARIRSLFSFANALQYRFVVRPDIKSVADLKGKRVGVAGFGLGLIPGRRSY